MDKGSKQMSEKHARRWMARNRMEIVGVNMGVRQASKSFRRAYERAKSALLAAGYSELDHKGNVVEQKEAVNE